METTGYVNWKPASLTAGKYQLKVVFAETFRGKNADDNGEVSVGMKFQYEVTGPQEALLSNGAPALGYRFSELMLEPKRSSSLKYVEMCNHKWNSQFKAFFGDNVPAKVEPEDFFDREFMASLKPKWSDFDQAEVPEISYRNAIGQ